MKTLFTRLKQSPLFIGFILSHLIFLIILGLRGAGMLQSLELVAYDTALWFQPKEQTEERITMVWLTDEDQRRWGWPLSDDKLTTLLETIFVHKPKAFGLDIYRDLPVPIDKGDAYQRLTAFFKSKSNIIAIMKFKNVDGARVDPPPALKGTHQIGFNDLPVDVANNAIRRGLLYVADEYDVYEYFGLVLARYYLHQFGIMPEGVPDNPSAVKLGEAIFEPLPSDFGGYADEDMNGFQFMLSYPEATEEYPSVTVSDILDGNYDPALFKGKVIIMGLRAEATPDFLYTPFSRWMENDPRMPGALIHAHALNQLIRLALGEERSMTAFTETQEILWIWLWTILGGVICVWVHSIWSVGLLGVGGVFTIGLAGYSALMYHIWLIMAAPILGWILAFGTVVIYLSSQEKSQRQVLMQLFSKHVSKNVAEEIWNQREQFLSAGRLRSQRLTATVLFTDLQNFTTVSEQMEPQALMDWLNQYMETMVNVVEKEHCGQVNKFIGDAIMAIFGVPIARQTPEEIGKDAINAVECALSMRREIERLQKEWEDKGQPSIRMRVGIYTGPVVAGSLGGLERQEYTVLGDTVNTAARLESFNKEIDTESPCRILIGQSTLEYLTPQFKTEIVGEETLKGKHSKVTIHKVLAGD